MIALAFAALVAAQSPDPIQARIELVLKATAWGRSAKGKAYAGELASRIRIESSRRVLDATALTAISDVEANFFPWARGKGIGGRHHELGPFQLIRGDTYVVEAGKRLAGCAPSAKLAKHLRPWWEKRRTDEGNTCEDQAVADRRVYHGDWQAMEFSDPWLSTYIAAYEISKHLEKARERSGWPVKVPKECDGLPVEVPRYAVFNAPGRPRVWYSKRVCQRYRAISR